MVEVVPKKWKIFVLVATSIFMSTLDSSIVNVALPYMLRDLQTSLETIQWVVLIYLVSVSALLLTFGRLSDIKGRRPVYVMGFTVFTAGSLLCGLSHTPLFLIGSRCIQAFGAAMLMACSPALVVDAFPEQERGKALGMIGAVVAAGLTTGPVIGGMILEYGSWRLIFFINIPIGLAAALGGLMVMGNLPGAAGSGEPMDKTGSCLLILVLSGLVLFLTQLPNWGLVSLPSLTVSSVAVLAGIGFVFNESRARYPLFDLSLVKIRMFVFPVVGASLMFAALFCLVFMMPFYLTYPRGMSASGTGLVMIAPFVFLLVVSPVSGLLYNRFGSRRLCFVGMGILTGSLVSLWRIEPSMDLMSLLWRMSLAGIGTALYTSPNNTAVMSSIPLNRRGIASGAVATARNIGMVLGVAIAGLVFSTSFASLTGGARLENYTPAMEAVFMISFRRAVMTGAVLSGIGMLITLVRGREIRSSL